MSITNKKGFPFILNDCGVCSNPDTEVLYEGKPSYVEYVKIKLAYYDGSWKYGYSIQNKTSGSSCGPWKGEYPECNYPTRKVARQAAIEYVMKEVKNWKNGNVVRSKIALLTKQHTLF